MPRVVCLCLMLLLPALASAQSNPVLAGQPFSVGFDHDGTGAPTAFRCYVNAAKVGADLPATAPKVCAIPGQPVGPHTVEVSAVNAFGEGPKASLVVTAGTPPSGPTNLRIVIQVAVQPSGDVTLLAAAVSREP